MQRRLDDATVQQHAEAVRRDSFTVLPGHFTAVLDEWRAAFQPLFDAYVRKNADNADRGGNRYYVTLPFVPPFDDERVVFDPDILAICDALVGPDMVLCQLASDTPVRGSDYQDLHRDAPPLFAEWGGRETPPFQLAVNFSLVDVTAANGPLEVIRGSHMEPRADVLAKLERGDVQIEQVALKAGDALVRDVRHVHRGTPNTTDEPRPMVVAGYSRRWLRRPEVSIRVPRSRLATLAPHQRKLLRFEPVVPDDQARVEAETYAAFAF